jgi:hypothetical protein
MSSTVSRARSRFTDVDANNHIIAVGLHVNGAKDVQRSAAGSSYTDERAVHRTGNGCHGSGTWNGW